MTSSIICSDVIITKQRLTHLMCSRDKGTVVDKLQEVEKWSCWCLSQIIWLLLMIFQSNLVKLRNQQNNRPFGCYSRYHLILVANNYANYGCYNQSKIAETRLDEIGPLGSQLNKKSLKMDLYLLIICVTGIREILEVNPIGAVTFTCEAC